MMAARRRCHTFFSAVRGAVAVRSSRWGAVKPDDGQTLVEYALIAFLVAITSLIALGAIQAALTGNKVQICRSLACPSGQVRSAADACDDPPPVCM